MNLGTVFSCFVLGFSLLGALVSCQLEPRPDLPSIIEPVSTPILEPTPEPATVTISTVTTEVLVAEPDPTKTPALEATTEPVASPAVEETTAVSDESGKTGGFSAVDYGDETANGDPQTDLEDIFDSEIQGFRTHSLPGWGSLEIPEYWHIIYSPTPGLLLISSKDAESAEDTSEEDALLQISELGAQDWLPIDIIREDFLPNLGYEWELVSEPEVITINDQNAATVTYHGYEDFMEQITIYQSTDGSRTVYLLAVIGEEKWPEYETIFEQIQNSVSISPVTAGPELSPGEDLSEDYAINVDDEQGYQFGYPSAWQGVGPLPVVLSPPDTSLPAQFEFKIGTVFIYPPSHYVISDDPAEGSPTEGFTAEGQVVALWDWAGTMAIQDAMMTSELNHKQVGDSEYAAAYFVATDQSRDNQPIYGFMGAVTDGEKAVKMISWFDDPQEYREVWLNIFNSIHLIEAEPLKPEPTASSVAVIRIEADGSGDYNSLDEAINEVTPGTTINLGPGTFRLEEPLYIEKAVHLVGAGMDQTEIVADAGEFVVYFSGEGPFISEDIAYRYDGTQVSDVILARDGEVSFVRNRFTGAVYDSETAKGGKGLWLMNATGLVSECIAENNDLAGIHVQTDNTTDLITLERNILSDNPAGVGLVFVGNAQGTARQNECSRNEQGIIVTDQAQPTLEANVCNENVVNGIAFYLESGGIARQNECSRNEQGIIVTDQAQPTLEANICNESVGNGIAFYLESGGIARGNDVSHNEFGGIEVNQSAQPILEENFCRYNGGNGILYLGNSSGKARGNDCSQNDQNGIDLGDTAQPTLEENICKENAFDGIAYYEQSGGTARANNCNGNGKNGIAVRDDAQPTLLENICSGNSLAGISYMENTSGLASKNTCAENQIGFWVDEEASPTLEDNVGRSNEVAGIYYWGNAKGVARLNELSGNGLCIYVPETADPELEDNLCYDNIDGEIVDERQ